MTWSERLRAALHGDVGGGDVAALIASSAPMGELEQRLEDRNLEEQIAHPQDAWAAHEAVAEAACPLWVASTLVRAAQAIADAEGQTMSPAGHEAALTLLDPLEDLLLDASASLADPQRRSGVRLPLTLRRSPGGSSPAFVKGLINAIEQVQTDVVVRRADVGKVSPAWAKDELASIDASLAAADTKLQMVRSRTIELLAGNRVDVQTLRSAGNDLWDLLDMLLTVGQKLTLPRLMAGHPRPSPAPPPRPTVPALSAAPPPPAPPPPPIEEGPVMPEIAAGRPATPGHFPSRPTSPASPSEPAMPDIGGSRLGRRPAEETAPAMPDIAGGRPATPKPRSEDEDLMPDIGGGLR